MQKILICCADEHGACLNRLCLHVAREEKASWLQEFELHVVSHLSCHEKMVWKLKWTVFKHKNLSCM